VINRIEYQIPNCELSVILLCDVNVIGCYLILCYHYRYYRQSAFATGEEWGGCWVPTSQHLILLLSQMVSVGIIITIDQVSISYTPPTSSAHYQSNRNTNTNNDNQNRDRVQAVIRQNDSKQSDCQKAVGEVGEKWNEVKKQPDGQNGLEGWKVRCEKWEQRMSRSGWSPRPLGQFGRAVTTVRWNLISRVGSWSTSVDKDLTVLSLSTFVCYDLVVVSWQLISNNLLLFGSKRIRSFRI